MPVDDIPVHEKVRHTRPMALCNTNHPKHEALCKTLCRHVGAMIHGVWQYLDECRGCEHPKDLPYIVKARSDIDKDLNRD